MSASTESIMAALFALLQSAASFTTSARRLKTFAQVPTADRPALFQYEGDKVEYKTQSKNLPAIVTFSVKAIIYFDSSQDVAAPATQMNALQDAIVATLKPPAGYGFQTLGGLVTDCRIEGEIIRDPGDLDFQGLLLFPIKILATV